MPAHAGLVNTHQSAHSRFASRRPTNARLCTRCGTQGGQNHADTARGRLGSHHDEIRSSGLRGSRRALSGSPTPAPTPHRSACYTARASPRCERAWELRDHRARAECLRRASRVRTYATKRHCAARWRGSESAESRTGPGRASCKQRCSVCPWATQGLSFRAACTCSPALQASVASPSLYALTRTVQLQLSVKQMQNRPRGAGLYEVVCKRARCPLCREPTGSTAPTGSAARGTRPRAAYSRLPATQTVLGPLSMAAPRVAGVPAVRPSTSGCTASAASAPRPPGPSEHWSPAYRARAAAHRSGRDHLRFALGSPILQATQPCLTRASPAPSLRPARTPATAVARVHRRSHITVSRRRGARRPR